MKHHETSWNIMKHHEASWNIIKHHETSWNIIKHHELSNLSMILLMFWPLMKPWDSHRTARSGEPRTERRSVQGALEEPLSEVAVTFSIDHTWNIYTYEYVLCIYIYMYIEIAFIYIYILKNTHIYIYIWYLFIYISAYVYLNHGILCVCFWGLGYD